ncbi:uncharacterized protein EI97DRAFT_90037 [Westerdykella ornata]|uniref:Uncharacterized protein n=1 Tax=Westerdykella ornata TaxID=318751 RepID=A0A6A6JF94_WESOR|nr:uncharacterized protein EI97DRAFT_90037 [Westerdykella ornata]KAF2274823.1 hypothetical protein EI97DRAFT_90037 [Westerdykella ornata]
MEARACFQSDAPTEIFLDRDRWLCVLRRPSYRQLGNRKGCIKDGVDACSRDCITTSTPPIVSHPTSNKNTSVHTLAYPSVYIHIQHTHIQINHSANNVHPRRPQRAPCQRHSAILLPRHVHAQRLPDPFPPSHRTGPEVLPQWRAPLDLLPGRRRGRVSEGGYYGAGGWI